MRNEFLLLRTELVPQRICRIGGIEFSVLLAHLLSRVRLPIGGVAVISHVEALDCSDRANPQALTDYFNKRVDMHSAFGSVIHRVQECHEGRFLGYRTAALGIRTPLHNINLNLPSNLKEIRHPSC